ncbi:MAG: hypothetical protein C4519_15555 [Desulfobacteraceae bacterium]|nr:MAG: hypothetical protein C4519_15555 [Desulfobacteraceae bacterium]
MKSRGFLMVGAFVVVFLMQLTAWAGEPCGKEAVIKAVEQAVAILEKEGPAGLEKVGQIRFCGDNYVFVNDLKGKTLMHANGQLIGKILIALKDDTGKRFFADFTEVAQKSQATHNGQSYFNGCDWVAYRWPKPGQQSFSPKESYVKGCLMGDTNVYVGAGIYLP